MDRPARSGPRGAGEVLPADIHDDVIDRLLAPLVHDDEPRPGLDGRKTYVFGVLVTPIVLPERGAVYFQEVDFVRDARARRDGAKERRRTASRSALDLPTDGRAGLIVAALADTVAESFLAAVDALDDEVDAARRRRGERRRGGRCGGASVRFAINCCACVASSARRARRSIASSTNASTSKGTELLPHEVEIAFGDAYDKLLRAIDGLDLARDLLAGSARLPSGEDRERPERGDEDAHRHRVAAPRCRRSSSASTARTSSTTSPSSTGSTATCGRGSSSSRRRACSCCSSDEALDLS